jgi:hypothetical protein
VRRAREEHDGEEGCDPAHDGSLEHRRPYVT